MRLYIRSARFCAKEGRLLLAHNPFILTSHFKPKPIHPWGP